tara:strand:+ start:23250 stop:24203 length:954 start_codon:yes stop_codon:yes gene_type:complete
MSWRPTAKLQILQRRAQLLATIREFFATRGVLEIDTPLLCSSSVTDPALEPLLVERGVSVCAPRFLQTSPEYAMKRVLAMFGEPVFQICKAFRDGEAGARHNPEFTLLEWYRPGFDHHQLMAEVAGLVVHCIGERPLHKYAYRELFVAELGVDPMTATATTLASVAAEHVDTGNLDGDRDMWLDLLMSHVIEPRLAGRGMCCVFDYPASQAALARNVPAGDVEVGQRFELYVDGLELANGYCELADAAEQRRRFEADNARRSERGQPVRAVDEQLLAALEYGLPDCSGVALGVDRLLMLAVGSADIREVLAFDWASS